MNLRLVYSASVRTPTISWSILLEILQINIVKIGRLLESSLFDFCLGNIVLSYKDVAMRFFRLPLRPFDNIIKIL